jgi:ribosomal protein L11 methyltransferase
VTSDHWRVLVSCPPSDTDRVAARLVALTGQGVEEPDPGTLITIAPDRTAAERLRDGLAAEFAGVTVTFEPAVAIDWSEHWRDGIITRRFGRLVVTPSWLPVSPAATERVLVLDPESAFGSGEHGSTRSALVLLERHLVPGASVLDLGSGSGILAIAAVLLGASRAMGIELDEEAIPIAEANAARNAVAPGAQFIEGDAWHLLPLLGPAGVICSNILRTVNTALLPRIAEALAPGGVAIFAGMEDVEADLFRPELASAGLLTVDEVHDSGWWGVAARRG